jgi:hypothetical protein
VLALILSLACGLFAFSVESFFLDLLWILAAASFSAVEAAAPLAMSEDS